MRSNFKLKQKLCFKHFLQVLFCIATVFPVAVFAQTRTVRGHVVEEGTGTPLVGVSVQVKGTAVGTVTNEAGDFEIGLPSDRAILVLSYAGKEAIEQVVSGGITVNITMRNQSDMLEEVYIGYMRQQKKDLTGAVAMVDAEDIARNPGSNALKSLQGRLAGVLINTNGGNPTEQVNIQVRGITSLSGAVQPLIVLDGMPMERLNLNDINANDIASIQVLKDAASASIYGARASGGVILIETKKGRPGRVTINYDGSASLEKVVAKPDIMDARGYGIMAFRAAAYDEKVYGTALEPALPRHAYNFIWHRNPDGLAILDDISLTDYLDNNNKVPTSNTNWLDQILRNGMRTNHQISVSSGTDRSKSFFSVGYYEATGTQIHTSFQKYSLRANNEYALIKNRLKIGQNLSINYLRLRDRSQQYPSMIMPPTVPVYDVDGNWAGAAGFDDFSNPVRVLTNEQDNYNHFVKTIASGFADLNIWKGLSARTQFGVDYTNSYSRRIDKEWRETGGRSSDGENFVGNDQGHRIGYVWTNTLSYRLAKGKSGLNAVAGSEYTWNVFEGFGARREGIYLEDRDFAGIGVATGEKWSMGSSADEYAYYSLFAKANYTYDNKYLLSATVRRDGSSLFGEAHRYGIFPAISAGWRLSEESFMKGNDFISDLKLRASWGENGSVQGLPRGYTTTPFSPVYSATAYPIAGNESGPLYSGYYRTWLGNPNLKWETTSQINFGLDYSILNRRLSGAFDLYFKKTTDILVQTPYIAAMGEGGEPWINGASMKNTGFEFELTYRNDPANKFQYSISANGGSFKAKIIDIPKNVINKYPGNGLDDNVIGGTPNVIYGLVADGIFRTQQEVDNHVTQSGAAIGRLRYRDVNGDSAIREISDRAYIAVLDPKFYGGMAFNFSYFNFDLNFNLQGVFGNEIYNQWKYESDFWGITLPSGKNHPTRLYDAWNFDNTDSRIPAASNVTSNAEQRTSSYFVESGSYLKLRNIDLGYTLPAGIAERMGMQKFRTYLMAQNVLTLRKTWGSNKFTGFDPEMPNYGYLIPLIVTFGVNVTF
ncbi:MAG: SusC/RagA family TonB-linked outer membrane protein [Niabella sp. SCN 42-15]|nr:MAG: SusC/RagA family TonB-linked outer membrane protein [Niabella sp. SCN 42-15]